MSMEDAKIRDNDGITKHRYLTGSTGKDSKLFIWELYNDCKMSGQEISDYVYDKFKVKLTARSIQRTVSSYGKYLGILKPTRSVKEAFNLAISKGRVKWAFKALKVKRLKLSPKLRYFVLKRDGFKCKACGSTELLEADHIIPLDKGGKDTAENLQTLCHYCNQGKYLNEK